MAMQRPENPALRRFADKLRADRSVPILDEEQIAKLEALYPPRCMHLGETVEAHSRYAGMVTLVGLLRSWHDRAKAEEEVDPAGEGDNEVNLPTG